MNKPKSKPKKKLSRLTVALHPETIRNLTIPQLARAQGGLTVPTGSECGPGCDGGGGGQSDYPPCDTSAVTCYDNVCATWDNACSGGPICTGSGFACP